MKQQHRVVIEYVGQAHGEAIYRLECEQHDYYATSYPADQIADLLQEHLQESEAQHGD